MRNKWLMLAVLLVVMAGCQKQNGKNMVGAVAKHGQLMKEEQGRGLATSRYTNADNELNVFDHVGKEHNKVLGEVIEHVLETGDDSMDGIRDFLVSHYKQQGGVSILESLGEVEAMMAEAEGNFGYFLKHPDLPASFRGYLVELKGFLDGLNNKEDLSNFVQQVKFLESEIMEADLAEKERNGLLQVTSIARHSAWFWTQLGPMNYPKRNPETEMPRWLREILAAKAFITVDMLAMIGGVILNHEDAESDAVGLSSFCATGMRNGW